MLHTAENIGRKPQARISVRRHFSKVTLYYNRLPKLVKIVFTNTVDVKYTKNLSHGKTLFTIEFKSRQIISKIDFN